MGTQAQLQQIAHPGASPAAKRQLFTLAAVTAHLPPPLPHSRAQPAYCSWCGPRRRLGPWLQNKGHTRHRGTHGLHCSTPGLHTLYTRLAHTGAMPP